MRDRNRGRRKPSSLSRKVAIRKPKKTLTVFCEGSVSEVAYLEALAAMPEVRDGAAVDIKVQRDHGVPMSLVKYAIAAKKNGRREASEVDEYWCVFDVEWPQTHPNIYDAKQKADANQIRLAISNPCFELWLTLHFRQYGAPLTTDNAISVRKKCDGTTDKHLDPGLYMSKRGQAVDRARALAAQHQSGGSAFPDDNPSSGMYLLLASVDPTC